MRDDALRQLTDRFGEPATAAVPFPPGRYLDADMPAGRETLVFTRGAQPRETLTDTLADLAAVGADERLPALLCDLDARRLLPLRYHAQSGRLSVSVREDMALPVHAHWRAVEPVATAARRSCSRAQLTVALGREFASEHVASARDRYVAARYEKTLGVLADAGAADLNDLDLGETALVIDLDEPEPRLYPVARRNGTVELARGRAVLLDADTADIEAALGA